MRCLVAVAAGVAAGWLLGLVDPRAHTHPAIREAARGRVACLRHSCSHCPRTYWRGAPRRVALW